MSRTPPWEIFSAIHLLRISSCAGVEQLGDFLCGPQFCALDVGLRMDWVVAQWAGHTSAPGAIRDWCVGGKEGDAVLTGTFHSFVLVTSQKSTNLTKRVGGTFFLQKFHPLSLKKKGAAQ